MMNPTTLILDIAVVPGGAVTAAFLAVGFFLVFAAIAFVVFKMLKRTVKMAVRMVIAGIILLVAMVGAVTFMYVSSTGSPSRPAAPATRSR